MSVIATDLTPTGMFRWVSIWRRFPIGRALSLPPAPLVCAGQRKDSEGVKSTEQATDSGQSSPADRCCCQNERAGAIQLLTCVGEAGLSGRDPPRLVC